LEAAGIPGERIHVLPPFVHGLAPPTTVASSGGYILFSGRLVWAKGIFDFLDALARLPDRIPAVVAGGGTVDTQVAERTRALGLGHRVRFLGWTAHRGMADVLAGARVVVMPSRWQEPFGIAGLEALAAGRPVAAYEGGGIGDWLENGRTGRIAPSGNSALLAEAILELWDRPDQADAYGQAGRILTAGRFDPGRLMARLEDVYKGMSRNSSR
jgi:glycosyltransferase involved in cell wall biosynthesis